MANEKRNTVVALIIVAVGLYFLIINTGTIIFGNNIVGAIVNILGAPIAILAVVLMAIFTVGALMLDIKQYGSYFIAVVFGIVAIGFWISGVDLPGPFEEILFTAISGLFFKKAFTPKSQDKLMVL